MTTSPTHVFVSLIRRLIYLLILLAVVLSPGLGNPSPSRAEPQALMPSCHVGIDTPWGVDLVDLSTVGVIGYMNWGPIAYPTIEPPIEQAKVLRIGNEKLNRYGQPCGRDTYTDTMASLSYYVNRYDNAVWMVGNEPDTTYSCQDDITAQEYGQRYYEIASAIKAQDPGAKVSFGSIVQPTPIRIRYLTYAWNELVSQAGSVNAASQLIDFWNIHAFILNEDATPNSWGTGVPRGFENDHDDAIIITDLTDAYDIGIFTQRMVAFRQFMDSLGEQNKPLWISEYGNLYPPLDDYGYYTVTDEVTRDYMLATFDAMLQTKNANYGYPGDDNRLVQRWFWYGLYHDRAQHGGSLFDPHTGESTAVGDGFLQYNPVGKADAVNPDITFDSGETALQYVGFANPGRTLVNYLVKVRLRNQVNMDIQPQVRLKIYEGLSLVGETTGHVMRCLGVSDLYIPWNNVQPGELHSLRIVAEIVSGTGSGTEIDPSDNETFYDVTPVWPQALFAPWVTR
jgi:hypothetical protein